jgi:hypothetical protein
MKSISFVILVIVAALFYSSGDVEVASWLCLAAMAVLFFGGDGEK